MKISMTVFSADRVKVSTPAALADGSIVRAEVDGLRVQLISDVHGSWTLNLVGEDARGWAAEPGAALELTL